MNVHEKAKNTYNKLSSILGGGLGNFTAATEILRDLTGKSSIDEMSEAEAVKFHENIQTKYGAWKASTSENYAPRSTNGSHKIIPNVAEIYEKWNGVKKNSANIKRPGKEKLNDQAETNTRCDPADDAPLPRAPKKEKKKKTLDDIAREVYAPKE